MQSIGGYFNLEIRKGNGHYHKNALRLNTARNCFEYILKAKQYKKVYIPYYTCEVMLEPLRKCGVGYEFYHINLALEPEILPDLREGESFLYTNYFGLKQNCVERLASHYGNRLIVDNAQAFYSPILSGIDTFYSARKFFGVADGAYLYTDRCLDELWERDCSYERMSHLLKRADVGAEEGYSDFKKNDVALENNPIRFMSALTEKILGGIDYVQASEQRRRNFGVLYNALKDRNILKIYKDGERDSTPMVYPFLLENGAVLRSKLIENKIFVATYWPNVLSWCRQDDLEYRLAENCLSLPIDQRYGEEEMEFIIDTIRKYGKI